MKPRLTILGSGSCNIIVGKAAASVLIERDDLRFVYDFGPGTAVRLVEAGLKQDDIEHIFISHFHPDHVTDLYPYLHAASWSQIDRRTKDLTIYGPSGTASFIDKMFSVFDWGMQGRGFAINVKEVEDGIIDMGGQTFGAVDLHHSRGLWFDDVAIAGDTNLNDDLVELLKGRRIGIFDAGHLSEDDIRNIAVRTQTEKLVCSHQYRVLDENALNESARLQGYTGRIIVAHDGMKFENKA